jgi:acyl-CoA reductase-like NAD-dependent aldehyde dehydrogenase
MATAPKILPGKLFINGEWREASDGERRDVINPATGTVVSSIAWATAADVDAAVRTIAGSARSMGVIVEGV